MVLQVWPWLVLQRMIQLAGPGGQGRGPAGAQYCQVWGMVLTAYVQVSATGKPASIFVETLAELVPGIWGLCYTWHCGRDSCGCWWYQ